MMDQLAAKKQMLEEILKMAGEAKMQGLKSKFAPTPPPAPEEKELEIESPEGDGEGLELSSVKAEGDLSEKPEVLQKLLELLGG